jgi:hypothetical protein
MSEKTVVITETSGKYKIQKNEVSDFELIGILECILFDFKSNSRQAEDGEQSRSLVEQEQTVSEPKEKLQKTTPPDLRTRISNAVKAIKSLGGQIETSDLTNATDEELQNELDELTNQYKRLKNSKG